MIYLFVSDNLKSNLALLLASVHEFGPHWCVQLFIFFFLSISTTIRSRLAVFADIYFSSMANEQVEGEHNIHYQYTRNKRHHQNANFNAK